MDITHIDSFTGHQRSEKTDSTVSQGHTVILASPIPCRRERKVNARPWPCTTASQSEEIMIIDHPHKRTGTDVGQAMFNPERTRAIA